MTPEYARNAAFFRKLGYLNLVVDIIVIVVLTIAVIGFAQALNSNAGIQRQQCIASSESAVTRFNWDYYVYTADFQAARVKGIPPASRTIRLKEAQNLLAQDELRAHFRIDVGVLRLRPPFRLLDPRIREVVRRTNFSCVRRYANPLP